MKKRILVLSLMASLLASSCSAEQEISKTDSQTTVSEVEAQTSVVTTEATTTPEKTTATTKSSEATTTLPVTEETTAVTTTALSAESTTTTTIVTTTEETTAAQPSIPAFEAVHLPRAEKVGYGDFLGYREVFDSVEQSENPRGSAQLINIDDVIYCYMGDIPKEKSGYPVTEYLSHNEDFISAFNGEPTYNQLYSLSLIGTGISTLDVFDLENLSATKEYSPYFRLSDDFVISIDDYYKKTEWESCSFSVWERNESLTNMCRTAKLLWSVREKYQVKNITKIWPAYTDEPSYLEINAPKEYHSTIANFLSANNVKSGYKFRTVYLPQEKTLNEYSDKILREDYAVYISTAEKQYSPEDVYVLNYGGSYNGNEVVIMDLCTNSMSDYTSAYSVGDYWLEAPGDSKILLHKNGAFMSVEDAYSTGNLIPEDLAMLEKTLPTLYTNPKPVPVPEPTLPLTEEADLQLRTDYAAFKGEEGPDKVEVVKYFGTYDGKEVVIMYQKDAVVTDDMSYTSVNGYLIAVGSGCYDITVHHCGNFYTLQEAYNKGYLTEKDLKAVVYYSENSIVYEE